MYRKIIHFHIAKTGGTSLNTWLDTLVPACRARPGARGHAFSRLCASVDDRAQRLLADRKQFHPLHRVDFDWAALIAHREEESTTLNLARAFVRVAEYGREARAYWDVVHDHCPALPTADRSAYRIVVLRHPLDRFLSFLRDWRRLSESDLAILPPKARSLRRVAMEADADAFVRCAVETTLITGLTQVCALMSAAIRVLPHDHLATCDPSPLALASKALESLFDTVGVVERMDDVVRCIARDVGACPVESLGRYNQGVADPGRDALSTESQRILHEVCSDDFKLYGKAESMLEARLLPAYGPADFETQHLERRLEQLTPRFSDGRRVFSLNDQIIGCGFHGRDAADTETVTVWSGPGTRTVLYLPVPPGEWLDLFVDIGGYIHPSVRESLRIRVDGRDCSFQRTVARGVLERVVVPVRTTRPHCKVELLVDRTFTPAEAGHAGGDARRLGIALRGYGYQLTPTEGVVMRYSDESPAFDCGRNGALPDDVPHPEAAWGGRVTQAWLGSLAAESDPERLVAMLAWDVAAAEMEASPTAAAVEHAFERLLMRPAPQEWIDFWVGRPGATLRQLYRDVVAGAEFRQQLARLGPAAR